MTREVYSDKKFIEFSRNHVFMRIFADTDQEGRNLAYRYNVEGFPTLIIFDSEGREVDRILGFISASELIEVLEYIFEAAEDGPISI